MQAARQTAGSENAQCAAERAGAAGTVTEPRYSGAPAAYAGVRKVRLAEEPANAAVAVMLCENGIRRVNNSRTPSGAAAA